MTLVIFFCICFTVTKQNYFFVYLRGHYYNVIITLYVTTSKVCYVIIYHLFIHFGFMKYILL